MNQNHCFIKSHRDRQSEILLKMNASEVSISELLPYTRAEGELSWGSEEEGLA